MKKLILLALFPFYSLAQVGINTTTPDASSLLEIASTNKGFLPPRIALTAVNSTTPITSPATALLVYNTATSGLGINQVTPGYYYWDGSQWIRLITTAPSASGWGLSGNTGISSATNFIGTADDNDVVFKRNSTFSGMLTNYNTSFGKNSFNPATNTGNYNSAFGIFNINGTNSGNYNTAVGFSNLTGVNSGSRNTVLGCQNLMANTSGTANIAIGYAVLPSNTTGGNNIAMGGFTSLYKNTTGNGNISFGAAALYNNTTGSYNVAIGDTSLYNNTTASNNMAIGYYSMYSSSTGANNTAVGVYSASANTTGNNNTAVGNYAMYINNSGQNNVAVGQSSGYYMTGSNNITLGYDAQVPVAANNDQIRIGNTGITYAGTQVAWSITSDQRWKSNIQNLNLGLAFVSKLRPVSYFRSNDFSKKVEFGFIAQELEATLLEYNASNNGMIAKDDHGMYSVRYNDLFAPLVKAIQEQQELFILEKKKNEKLQNQVDALEARLDKMEKQLRKI